MIRQRYLFTKWLLEVYCNIDLGESTSWLVFSVQLSLFLKSKEGRLRGTRRSQQKNRHWENHESGTCMIIGREKEVWGRNLWRGTVFFLAYIRIEKLDLGTFCVFRIFSLFLYCVDRFHIFWIWISVFISSWINIWYFVIFLVFDTCW